MGVSDDLINQFLSLARPQAVAIALEYKSELREGGYSESTIN